MPRKIYEPLKEVWDRHLTVRRAINLGHNGLRTEEILWNLMNGELELSPSLKILILLIGINNTEQNRRSKFFAWTHRSTGRGRGWCHCQPDSPVASID